MLAEIIEYNRTLEAFVIAAEAGSFVNESGVMVPDVMMLTTGRLYGIRCYPHIIHVLQEMCGQGLVMRFGKAAFENPEIGHHLLELLPGRGVTGMQKEHLMNFIWDLTSSSLAGRVALFENVNASPAPRMRERLVNEFNRSHLVKKAREAAGL
ncbi:4-hydroxyphenylacetate 3-hydroxylase C-terminal domain-containing protein [Xaviernesmea oryzae]|uniref:4-hydroxyphenylacetate 3-hydroxylase C-terminal domain-containing protein n=1 Tax=Xaviernesmea oryzae TaxID=464029 RepID=UPI000A18C920|nr:4-hydroxyphenylacetate 3-hydroxylase C-terminal domain-containing protein [Xaviernesmea oryzae]